MLPVVRVLRTGVLLLAVAAPAALTSSCNRMMRYPVRDPATYAGFAEDDLRTRLNPYLLTTAVFDRVVVEIDWVDGCEPAPKAVRRLERVLGTVLPAELEVEVVVDDRIERARWDRAVAAGAIDALAGESIDRLPDLVGRTEVVYVLYLPRHPDRPEAFGAAVPWTFERDGVVHEVSGLFVSRDNLERRALLWVTANRIDRSTLVHEFGHVLGLVADPRHAQARRHEHCRNPHCVMTHPFARSITYWALVGPLGARLPDDYCRECRRELARVQELWDEDARTNPDFAERLRARRRN
jgi:hypothetical protein